MMGVSVKRGMSNTINMIRVDRVDCRVDKSSHQGDLEIFWLVLLVRDRLLKSKEL